MVISRQHVHHLIIIIYDCLPILVYSMIMITFDHSKNPPYPSNCFFFSKMCNLLITYCHFCCIFYILICHYIYIYMCTIQTVYMYVSFISSCSWDTKCLLIFKCNNVLIIAFSQHWENEWFDEINEIIDLHPVRIQNIVHR